VARLLVENTLDGSMTTERVERLQDIADVAELAVATGAEPIALDLRLEALARRLRFVERRRVERARRQRVRIRLRQRITEQLAPHDGAAVERVGLFQVRGEERAALEQARAGRPRQAWVLAAPAVGLHPVQTS